MGVGIGAKVGLGRGVAVGRAAMVASTAAAIAAWVSVVGAVVAREGASMIGGGGVAVIGDELAQAVEASAKSKHIPETDLLTVVVLYQNLHQEVTLSQIPQMVVTLHNARMSPLRHRGAVGYTRSRTADKPQSECSYVCHCTSSCSPGGCLSSNDDFLGLDESHGQLSRWCGEFSTS